MVKSYLLIRKIEDICDYNIQGNEKVILILKIIEEWRDEESDVKVTKTAPCDCPCDINGFCLKCRMNIRHSCICDHSTKEVINSQESQNNRGKPNATMTAKVVPEIDKTSDNIHQQNKLLLDKDYHKPIQFIKNDIVSLLKVAKDLDTKEDLHEQEKGK